MVTQNALERMVIAREIRKATVTQESMDRAQIFKIQKLTLSKDF